MDIKMFHNRSNRTQGQVGVEKRELPKLFLNFLVWTAKCMDDDTDSWAEEGRHELFGTRGESGVGERGKFGTCYVRSLGGWV